MGEGEGEGGSESDSGGESESEWVGGWMRKNGMDGEEKRSEELEERKGK